MPKTLDDVIKGIQKKYGEFALISPGDEKPALQIPAISTGSLALDLACGGGTRFAGFYRGAINVIWGPDGVGKSTICYHAIANAQKEGRVAIADLEYKMDWAYAAQIGIDCDSLYVVQPIRISEIDVDGERVSVSDPLAGEDIISIIDQLVRTGEFALVVVDSAAAITPRRELEGEYGEANVGMQARLVSQAVRKLAGVVKASQTALVFTNQVRAPIGEMQTFGPPLPKQPGAKALMHYATMMVQLSFGGRLKERDEIIGIKTRAIINKNQGALPFKRAEFYITRGQGIDRGRELLSMGQDFGAVAKRGAYYYEVQKSPETGEVTDERIAQGEDNAATMIQENPELAARLEAAIRMAVDGEPEHENTTN